MVIQLISKENQAIIQLEEEMEIKDEIKIISIIFLNSLTLKKLGSIINYRKN